MDLFIVEVLLATVVLRFVMVGALAYLLMSRSTICPHCGSATTPVHRGWLGALLLPRVERRFCIECGWTGFVRKAPAVTEAALPPASARD
jgi:hypothetical protein